MDLTFCPSQTSPDQHEPKFAAPCRRIGAPTSGCPTSSSTIALWKWIPEDALDVNIWWDSEAQGSALAGQGKPGVPHYWLCECAQIRDPIDWSKIPVGATGIVTGSWWRGSADRVELAR